MRASAGAGPLTRSLVGPLADEDRASHRGIAVTDLCGDIDRHAADRAARTRQSVVRFLQALIEGEIADGFAPLLLGSASN